jgi:hypothetical protein
MLLRKYVFEYARIYLMLYLAIAAFLILWLGVYLNFTNPMLFSERAQVAYYFITLFLTGCLSSGVLFSELGSKSKAIHYLLLPASSLEKFLTNLVFGVLVFFVLYSAIFLGVDYIVVSIANYKFDTHWQVINLLSLNQYQNPFSEGGNTNTFYFYFPIQAVFLLCSVYFRKHGLFKAIVVTGLLWVLFVVLFILYQSLMPIGRFISGIELYEIIEPSGDNKLVRVPAVVSISTVVFFKFLLTPLLWAAAYFRLKEKEL